MMTDVKLVFRHWVKDGKSIEHTEFGHELSIGSLHGGSTFNAQMDLRAEDIADILLAKTQCVEPIFDLIVEVGQ